MIIRHLAGRWTLRLLALLLILGLAITHTYAQSGSELTITGEGPGDSFGWAVASAGDVNGDDILDLVAGAPTNDAVDGFAGRAYLFYGPFTTSLDAEDADAIISAEAFGDNLGVGVSTAGDVNNDGMDDLLIGARSNDGAGIQAGRVYLFLGPVNGSLDADEADAIISGEAFDELGWAMAPAGDLNGDGFADILTGARLAPGASAFAGQAYLFNGPISGNLSSADADAIIFGLDFNELLGTSLAHAGDLNDDGIDDIVIGGPRPPLQGTGTGRAYVFFGPLAGAVSAGEADVILTGEAENDEFGNSVAGAGDVNGDGVDDLLVGAHQFFTEQPGKTYLFYGPLSGSISAADADVIFTGEAANDDFGVSVSSAGDANGDGFDDVIIGAQENGGRAGEAYLFYGPLSGVVPAASADIVFSGQGHDQLGHAVASAGDLNQDGADDLILGAPQFDEGDPGYARIIFGQADEQEGGLTIAVTPNNPPIILPPNGGSFTFITEVSNQTGTAQTVDIWFTLSGPNGFNKTGRPVQVTIANGATLILNSTQKLTARTPAGAYTLTANVGFDFPVVEATDNFTVTKSAASSQE